MDKELLKNVILEKIGSEDKNSFLSFLRKISENLNEGEVLEISGIGNFQLKKEPLSRMERRGVSAEKTLLIFLPIGSKLESEVLTFDIDSTNVDNATFNESVFDVGIDKPTIISESGTPNEKIFNNIIELIESSHKKSNYDLLKDLEQSEVSDNLITDPFANDPSLDDINIADESSVDESVTEVEINENFLSNDNTEDETEMGLLADDETEDTTKEEESVDSNLQDEHEFEVVSSNIESIFTDEDVMESDEDVMESDEELSTNEEVKTVEINSAFTNEVPFEDEITQGTEPEVNPFDELDEYIKDETKDEAQEILDEEPSETEAIEEDNTEIDKSEVVEEKVVSEEKPKKKYSNYSAMRNKNTEWYKNPVLFIALFSAIIAIVVIIIFWPSAKNSEVANFDEERIPINELENKVDSNKNIIKDGNKEQISQTDKAIDEKLAEIKRLEKSSPSVKDEKVAKTVVKQKEQLTNSEIYRDIKNDKTIINRIYFDGERYTVQSSSWKSKTIAEREVSKLRKRGFDAFIYKVFIPAKGSTWNRVRIGYFNSQKEAEEFLKKNKI